MSLHWMRGQSIRIRIFARRITFGAMAIRLVGPSFPGYDGDGDHPLPYIGLVTDSNIEPLAYE